MSPTSHAGTLRREDIIFKYVEGKDVLDVGGVDHYAFRQKAAEGTWLHAHIAKRARRCLGIDILECRVKEALEHGFRFETANCEQLPYEDEFDVIVAGELVEHLYNMGLFLDGAWRALRPGGHLILTTPNNFALSRFLYAEIRGIEACHPEHTCYYSPQTLSYIVSRHGFSVVESHVLARQARRWFTERLYETICRLRPILGEVLVFVFERTARQDKYGEMW
jgi:SAM-dependent methyltransferase